MNSASKMIKVLVCDDGSGDADLVFRAGTEKGRKAFFKWMKQQDNEVSVTHQTMTMGEYRICVYHGKENA